MIRKIDHIGVAVKQINQALSLFEESLGLQLQGKDEVPSQKVRVAMLPVGDTRIELIEPTEAESNIAKFLDKKGEGIHHIAFEVSDLSAVLKQLEEKEVPLIHKTPVPGAHNTKIAFLHPKGTYGVLVELVERAED